MLILRELILSNVNERSKFLELLACLTFLQWRAPKLFTCMILKFVLSIIKAIAKGSLLANSRKIGPQILLQNLCYSFSHLKLMLVERISGFRNDLTFHCFPMRSEHNQFSKMSFWQITSTQEVPWKDPYLFHFKRLCSPFL